MLECNCGGTMIWKNGRYGGFYGCSNFPKCKNSFSSRLKVTKPYESVREYEEAKRAEYTAMWCDCFS